jgi:hypothetical protein
MRATQVGTWLSLVERTLGVGEVASSNLVVPTNNFSDLAGQSTAKEQTRERKGTLGVNACLNLRVYASHDETSDGVFGLTFVFGDGLSVQLNRYYPSRRMPVRQI